MTVSIGAAEYAPGETVHEWLARADAAMYQAKRDGRNRVVVAPTPALPAITPRRTTPRGR